MAGSMKQVLTDVGWKLVVAAIAFAVLIGALMLLTQLATNQETAPPQEVLQVLWLSLGVVLLLIVLLVIAVVLRVLDASENRGALGLPEGSISAVIALLLLVLFSLSSVYLYVQIREGEQTGQVSTGLTETDVEKLPADRVIKIERTGNPATYTVTLTNPSDQSTEVGRTALATISTLLVAIVGFYFGQRASEKGVGMGVELGKTRP